MLSKFFLQDLIHFQPEYLRVPRSNFDNWYLNNIKIFLCSIWNLCKEKLPIGSSSDIVSQFHHSMHGQSQNAMKGIHVILLHIPLFYGI